jgi:hypothetical protein
MLIDNRYSKNVKASWFTTSCKHVKWCIFRVSFGNLEISFSENEKDTKIVTYLQSQFSFMGGVEINK